MNDLDPDALREALPAWVADLRFLPATDSTNRQAMAWAAGGAAHGSLVVADFQTAGRGRLGREWVAPPGSSLLFSVVLRPTWDPERLPMLTLAAGVAVCECLAGLGMEPGLKWPNDVVLDGRKVAGILSELSGPVVIVGVGVNVKQEAFPAEIHETATSLQAASGRELNRLEVLVDLIGHLAPLVDGPAEEVRDRYLGWCRTLGREVRVDLGSGLVEDRAVDIDAFGGLVLAGGSVVRAGDVTQLR